MAVIKLNPDPEEYEQAESEFLAELGLCVSQWAFVDRQLFRIFHYCLGAKKPRSAAIYYKKNSLSQRMALVESVIEFGLLDAGVASNWTSIKSVFGKLVLTRNIIAHHPPKRTGTSKDGQATYIYSIHIEPYERALRKEYRGLNGRSELYIDDLRSHADAVQRLANDLVKFFEVVSSTKSQ